MRLEERDDLLLVDRTNHRVAGQDQAVRGEGFLVVPLGDAAREQRQEQGGCRDRCQADHTHRGAAHRDTLIRCLRLDKLLGYVGTPDIIGLLDHACQFGFGQT